MTSRPIRGDGADESDVVVDLDDLGVDEPRVAVAPLGVARLRVVLLAVAHVGVAVTACGIFDRLEWALIVAPLPPTVAALATIGRAGWTRVAAAVLAVATSTMIAVLTAGGSVGDVADAASTGFRGVMSTEWPSPVRPALLGSVALVLAASTALSAELASRRRFHLLPLFPLAVVEVLAVAFSAPAGVNWPSLILIGVCAVAVALMRNDGSLTERLVMLRGERRIVLLLAFVVLLVAVVTVPLSLTTRADPRQSDPPRSTAPVLDPIEATLALRALDPPRDLHLVTPTSGEALPLHWRTTALSEYDGERWLPELTLRPIGRTLGVADGPTIDAGISFLDDDLSLVPLPGPPVRVDAEVETDVERTIVRLVERPEIGQVVPIVAEVAPVAAADATVATRVIDDDVATLSTLAETLAETSAGGTPTQQLATLEDAMSAGTFVLDNGVQGGGLQRAFIDIFLRDTQRGNQEQFVTGFVLLARALGIEARVATGFVAPDAALVDGGLPLSSADATIWPEVQLTDGTWVVYDPVPDEETTTIAPPPPQPQAQTPAAPQPPIIPPPDPDNATQPPEVDDETQPTSTLSTALVWGLRGAGGLALVLLPFAVAAAIVLGAKARRRRRRLSAASPDDRIRGAWATATDALVDGGLTIPRSATDGEIAVEGEPLVADARRDLHRLAALSSTATFGSAGQEEYLADDAAKCLDAVERSMARERTRRQRLWWRLSLRSLRRSTRSPVSV